MDRLRAEASAVPGAALSATRAGPHDRRRDRAHRSTASRSKARIPSRSRPGATGSRPRYRTSPRSRTSSRIRPRTGSRCTVDVDRDTASRLGVTAASVDEALYSAFGQRVDLDDLHRDQPVSRDPRGEARRRDGTAGPRPREHANLDGPADAAHGDGRGPRARRAALDQPRRPVPGRDDRLRHRAQRLARPRGRRDPRDRGEHPHADEHHDGVPRRRERVTRRRCRTSSG